MRWRIGTAEPGNRKTRGGSPGAAGRVVLGRKARDSPRDARASAPGRKPQGGRAGVKPEAARRKGRQSNRRPQGGREDSRTRTRKGDEEAAEPGAARHMGRQMRTAAGGPSGVTRQRKAWLTLSITCGVSHRGADSTRAIGPRPR